MHEHAPLSVPSIGPSFAPKASERRDFAFVVMLVLAVFMAFGGAGCVFCVCVAHKSSALAPPRPRMPSPLPPRLSSPPRLPVADTWVTSEKPFVKFLAPPGWTRRVEGDWGTFTSPSGAAVFAFTTYRQANEWSRKVARAEVLLGLSEVRWQASKASTVGKDCFKARSAEGRAMLRGTSAYSWYALVDSRTATHILVVYALGARATQADRDAIGTALRSLQRR